MIKPVCQDSKALGQVLLLHDHSCGQLEFHRGKIPDPAYPALHHEEGGFLGRRRRNRQQSQRYVFALHQLRQIRYGKDLPVVDHMADLPGVAVEGSDNLQAERIEPAVAEQRASEVAATHDNGLCPAVPPEETLDSVDQVGDAKPEPGGTCRACGGKVLSNNHRLKMMHACEHRAGDVFATFSLQGAKHLQVSGQSSQARHTGLVG